MRAGIQGRHSGHSDRALTAVQQVPWPNVTLDSWKLTSVWALPPTWWSDLGYQCDVVDDDGLEYEVLCFAIDGVTVLLGRGVGGPENAWSFGTTALDGPSGDDLIARLGLSPVRYGPAETT